MIAINGRTLATSTIDELRAFQAEIDIKPTYEARVSEAKSKWDAKRSSRAITEVRATLSQMCSGIARCMYCEDSMADEIEHIHPKDLFPEMVFAWENYLFACGICNGGKNNKFMIFAALDGQQLDITRKRNAPVVEPPKGESVLINPRLADPMEYLVLDLRDTFEYQPHPLAPEPNGQTRAKYTIATLNLNERGFPTIRKQAYFNFRARLKEYVLEVKKDAPLQELELLVESLRGLPQPTVWREMKRQAGFIEELKDLFSQAPEAMEW